VSAERSRASGGARLYEIDGIRGWAALSVLLYHMHIEMFIVAWPEVNGFWPRFVIHGPLSVAVFFVLSGDVLASACLAGGVRAIDAMVVKRYARLTLPIAVSCLLVWLLMKLGLTFNREAGQVLHHEAWLGACLQFVPTVVSWLHYVLYGVYVSHNNHSAYNPFLWTMSIELVGSMLVFLFMYMHGRLRRPKAVLMALALGTFALKSFYWHFFVGALFAIWRREGVWEKWRQRPGSGAVAALVVLCSFAVDVWSQNVPAFSAYIAMLLGPLLVAAFYATPYFLAFFSNRVSRFLGHISFSLYLVHFAVLVSLSSWLVLHPYVLGVEGRASMVAIGLASSLVSVVAATLLWRLELRMLAGLARLPGCLFRPGA
jgi:peptidoglycan/LPS O-acetylase OafA/YrhL